MNDFKTFFKETLESPPPMGMVMKYNILRMNPNKEHLIFVEGSSDERFYGNSQYEILKSNSAYIYQPYSEKNGGKESVFFAYRHIKENKDLKDGSDKCIYIVDRDWDTALRSVHKWVSKKDEPFISITLGHSMECYFLEPPNIRVIFQRFGIERSLPDFESKKQKLVEDSAPYWALKSVIQYANKQEIFCKYRKKYSFSDIFSFDFSKSVFFNVDFMNEEIMLMRKAIQGNQQLERYYDIWLEKINNTPRYIRGHDYFNFLKTYLEHAINRKINEGELFDLVKEFDVELDIKVNK